ncbi:MAG: AAA family ATPase [Oscillospiraceae bacterium]|jgi:cell division protease FtsH|nr:AAA family ATPase [Oscillospiraceae bacterium]
MARTGRMIASAILIVLLTAGVWVMLRQPPWRTYPAFQQELQAGQIAEATISGDSVIYTTRGGERFRTDAPSTESFRERLMLAGVRVHSSEVQPLALLAIALGIAGGVILYSRTSGKHRSAKGMVIGEQIPETRFCDVAAQEEAIDNLRGLVEFIKDPEKYERFGARIPRGMLLYGPPGTGKTLLARALAGEAGVPFFNVCGSDFVQMYVGVGASRVREVFRRVRGAGKAVLFIDEIDALGRRRDNHNGNEEREQTLNALLTEMSGFRGDQGIVVLAATNRPDMLDEALLRPGRFDRQAEVGLPSCAQRLKILQVHARNKPLSKDIDLERLAYNSVYFSGAKLESLLNEAAIRAARRNAASIEPMDVEQSFETVMVGEQKQDRSGISAHEREITAYHEAGHALATYKLLPDSKLTRLSIIPSTRGMAGYSMAVQPDKMFQTRAELEAHVAIALAGRAAEELAFGARQVTTGASNDLARATEMCVRMTVEWGMDEEIGLPVRRVLGQYGINAGSEAARVKTNMDLLYRVTLKLLENERDTLIKLASALLEEELLTEDRLREIFSAVEESEAAG